MRPPRHPPSEISTTPRTRGDRAAARPRDAAPAASGAPAGRTSSAGQGPSDGPEDAGPRRAPSRVTRALRWGFAVAYLGIFPLHLARLLVPAGHRPGFMMAAYVLLFALGVCAWRGELDAGARRIAAHPRRALGTVALGIVVLLVLEVVGALVAGWLAGVVPGGMQELGNDTNIGQVLGMYPVPVIIAVLGMMGPFVEELFFRQILIPLIGDRTRPWVGVVVSGAAFGMVHMSSLQPSEWIGVIPHTCFGIAMGILFLCSRRNLLLPAGFHIVSNTSTFLVNA